MKLKPLVRAFLNRFGSRSKVNDSGLYQCYLRFFKQAHFAKLEAERKFYDQLLSPLQPRLIFDVGASNGNKAKIFADLGSQVICVEADKLAAANLKARFADNPSVRVIQKACGSQPGSAKLHVFSGSNEGYNTISQKWLDELANMDEDMPLGNRAVPSAVQEVAVTTVDEIIKEAGTPEYIKIDVEGFEEMVVKGISGKIPLLSIEANLPLFVTETIEIIKRRDEIDPSTRYNFVTTEPPVTFASAEWLSKDSILAVIQSDQYPYLEIYLRSTALLSKTSP